MQATFKPIKIDWINAQAIEAALAEVNGKSKEHTYNDYRMIAHLADAAEIGMNKLNIPKKDRSGASYVSISGDRVSSSYTKKTRTRNATKVQIDRRPSGWYLVSIERAEVFQQGGGNALVLTKAQESKAIEALKAKFIVK